MERLIVHEFKFASSLEISLHTALHNFCTATLHLATTALQNFLQQQKTVFMWPNYL